MEDTKTDRMSHITTAGIVANCAWAHLINALNIYRLTNKTDEGAFGLSNELILSQSCHCYN